MTPADWIWGAFPDPAWDLVKFLSLRAWNRVNGWEAKTARTLYKSGEITSNQRTQLTRWLRTTNWSSLLAALDAGESIFLDSLASALYGPLDAMTDTKRESSRDHARRVATEMWEPLCRNADNAMLLELNRECGDDRVASLVEQIAARSESVEVVATEWLARAALLDQDLGLRRWKVPLPTRGKESAGTLLVARHAVVPFVGRSVELGELTAWLAKPVGLSLRFIQGQGGAGKTRLAGEMCRRAARAGWRSGFWTDRPSSSQTLQLAALQAPRLIVIDYADARTDVADLLDQLAQYANVHCRCRVLLLERRHREINGSTEVNTLWSDAGAPLPLDDSPLTVAERIALFDGAVEAIRTRMDTIAAVGRPPLDHPPYDRAVIVAAAAAAYATGDPLNGARLSETDVLDRLEQHETRHWEKTAERLIAHQQEPPRPDIRPGVVAAGAVFGWPQAESTGLQLSFEEELAGILARIGVCHQREAVPAAQWLLQLYPGGRLPLDPLADHLIAKYLPSAAYQVAFAVEPGRVAARAIPTLARAATTSRDVATQCSEPAHAALGDLAAAVQEDDNPWAADAFRQSLRLAPSVPETVMDSLLADQSASSTKSVSAETTQLFAQTSATGSAGTIASRELELGRSLGDLAHRLTELGEDAEATAAAEAAVHRFESLSRTDSAYLVDLARALDQLASILSRGPRRHEAVALASRSVSIYWRLSS